MVRGSRRGGRAIAPALVCAGSILVASGSGGAAEPLPDLKCGGEKVTITWKNPVHSAGDTISGTNRDDVIQGGPRGEVIFGHGGRDVICGGGGDDQLNGGPERDKLRGEADGDHFGTIAPGGDISGDVVSGGGGHDTAAYKYSEVGVLVDMLRGVVVAQGTRGGGGIQGIEEVTGSHFDDQIRGTSEDESIKGEGGEDLIDGDGGEDFLSGGGDTDRVTFARADAAVQIRLDALKAVISDPRREVDKVLSFENAAGSRFNDRIIGTDDSNLLAGGGGNDTIKGLGGNDGLGGGAGNDTLHPGNGDDVIDGGPNDPVTGPEAPGDLVSYAEETYTDPDPSDGSTGLVVFLGPDHFGRSGYAYGPTTPDGTDSGDPGDDTLIRIESVRGLLTGGAKPFNELFGDDGPNVLIGGNSLDGLDGAGGNDFLFGLKGSDNLDGGPGDDYLDEGLGGGFNWGGDGDDTCEGASIETTEECEHGGPGDGEDRPALSLGQHLGLVN